MKDTRNTILFILCSLVGGMGWIFVPSQLQYISAELAVGYRFIIAGIITLFIAFLTRYNLRPISYKKQYIFLIQGICMFSINYILAYYALNYVRSGIVAALLSLLIIPNTIIESLLFKKNYTSRKLFILLIGAFGTFLLFISDYQGKNLGPSITKGIILCFCSMLFTSLGANLSQYMKKEKIDSIWAVGFAMLWGGVVACSYEFLNSKDFYIPMESNFLISLFILSALSTILFISYQIILTNKGAGFASYIWLVTPVVALLLSYIYENLILKKITIIGIIFILSGGLLNLNYKGIKDNASKNK